MAYKFTCTNCDNTWEIGFMGNYKPEHITNFPCAKCDKMTVISERLVSTKPVKESVAPHISYETRKKPSRDFRNIVDNIRKSHPNSTIQDKW